MHERWVEVAAGVQREHLLEVVRHLAFAFHAQVCFGIARLAAAFFPRSPLENSDRRAAFEGRYRCGETRDTATDHEDVGV